MQQIFGDVSDLQVCQLSTKIRPLNFTNGLGKKFCRTSLERCFVKYQEIRFSMVVDALIIITKELHHWEKTRVRVLTLLIANTARKILILQICRDFHA